MIIDDATGRVLEQWTGFQVAWTMARGYPGAFGRHVNALYIWLPLCAAVPAAVHRLPPAASRCCTSTCSCCCRSRSRWRSSTTRTSTRRCRSPIRRCCTCSCACSGCCAARGPHAGATPRPLRLLVPAPWLAFGVVFLLGFRIAPERHRRERDRRRLRGRDRRAARSSTTSRCTGTGRQTTNTATPTGRSTTRPTCRSSRSSAGAARWDDLPAAHAAAIVFDLLALALLFLLGRRMRGPTLGVALAYAWVAYPFTLFALESNSNDTLVAVLVLAALLVATLALAPRARGVRGARRADEVRAARARAGARHRTGCVRLGVAARPRALWRCSSSPSSLTGGARVDPGAHATTRCTRSTSARSTTRPTAARRSRCGGCTAACTACRRRCRCAAVALALALAVLPRRADVVGLAAACAAILIAVQLGDRTLVLPVHPVVLPARDDRAARALQRYACGRRPDVASAPARSRLPAAAREQRISTPISHGSSSEVSKRTGICVTQRLDRLLALDADHAAARAGHADVGDVGGAARQHARVGGRHVRVRAHHRGHAPVEDASPSRPSPRSPRRACRRARGRRSPELPQRRLDLGERRAARAQVQVAAEVDDAQAHAVALDHARAVARAGCAGSWPGARSAARSPGTGRSRGGGRCGCRA